MHHKDVSKVLCDGWKSYVGAVVLKIRRLNDDFAKSILKYEYEGRQAITEVFKAMVGSKFNCSALCVLPPFSLFSLLGKIKNNWTIKNIVCAIFFTCHKHHHFSSGNVTCVS